MPSKHCYFGCNRFNKLSVFSIPKNEILKVQWVKSLGVELSHSDVICERHFCAKQIKKEHAIPDKFGNIVCSIPLLRPRLVLNAVPCQSPPKNELEPCENCAKNRLELSEYCAKNVLRSNENYAKNGLELSENCAKNRLESSENCAKNGLESSENRANQDFHCESDKKILQNCTNFIVSEHNYSVPFDVSGSCCSSSSSNSSIIVDCNTNTTEKLQSLVLQNENRNSIIREFIKKSNNQIDLFEKLICWDLYLPPNWQKYLSHDKKCFAISEIIFKVQSDNINSFIRKSIIIRQHNYIITNVTCNILGKNISADKLVHFNGRIESQDQLQMLIKEMAAIRVCKGIDAMKIKTYSSFFFRTDKIVYDTMQIKRHSECPVISNRLHCAYCAKTIRNLYQRKKRVTKHSSPKQKLKISRGKKIVHFMNKE